GVCSSFIRCLGRESHNGWLGNPSAGSQPTLAESRHLSHFHRQPYCLGVLASHEKIMPTNRRRGRDRFIAIMAANMDSQIGAIDSPCFSDGGSIRNAKHVHIASSICVFSLVSFGCILSLFTV